MVSSRPLPAREARSISGLGQYESEPYSLDEDLSRKLSHILRYSAEKRGIKRDGDGYAKLNDLIRELRRTREEILDVVRVSSRHGESRFELSADGLLVRATSKVKPHTPGHASSSGNHNGQPSAGGQPEAQRQPEPSLWRPPNGSTVLIGPPPPPGEAASPVLPPPMLTPPPSLANQPTGMFPPLVRPSGTLPWPPPPPPPPGKPSAIAAAEGRRLEGDAEAAESTPPPPSSNTESLLWLSAPPPPEVPRAESERWLSASLPAELQEAACAVDPRPNDAPEEGAPSVPTGKRVPLASAGAPAKSSQPRPPPSGAHDPPANDELHLLREVTQELQRDNEDLRGIVAGISSENAALHRELKDLRQNMERLSERLQRQETTAWHQGLPTCSAIVTADFDGPAAGEGFATVYKGEEVMRFLAPNPRKFQYAYVQSSEQARRREGMPSEGWVPTANLAVKPKASPLQPRGGPPSKEPALPPT